MLFLLIHLGHDRYLIDARQVAEVLPLVEIMPLPQAPPAVVGVLDYRGTLVPVLDLTQLMLNRPAERRLHTRIVLIRHAPDDHRATALLGLIVEKVTETRRVGKAGFEHSGIAGAHAGSVVTDREGLAQRLDILMLLPGPVRELLCPQVTT